MNDIIEIPLQPTNQEFDIQMGKANYHLKITYMEFCGWTLDVMTQTREVILCGVPLVHGVDIFEQYRYLGLNGKLVLNCDEPESELDFNEIGKGNRLYFIPEP